MAKRKKAGRSKRPPAGPDPRIPWPAGLAYLVLRVYAGVFFLVTAHYKLVQEGYTVGEKLAAFRDNDYVSMISRAIEHPPVVLGVQLDLYADFLRDVMLPGAAVFAPAILIFEALLGIALVLGGGVRLMAGLGFLLMLAFSLAKPGGAGPQEPVGVYLFTVHSANWPLTFILLALCLVAAGRFLGLDVWIRRRGPAWVRWIG